MPLIKDDSMRKIAGRVMEIFPHWLVMWGDYTREFWAYPRFDVPAGTIAHAADAITLAGMLRRIQRLAADGYWDDSPAEP